MEQMAGVGEARYSAPCSRSPGGDRRACRWRQRYRPGSPAYQRSARRPRFLFEVLTQFIKVAQARDDFEFVELCRNAAKKIQRNIEKNGWDGEWYRRAYFDNGLPLGSASNDECQIDSISQSWSVLSGAGDTDRSKIAMESVNKRLVRREYSLVQLLDPPFDKSDLNPGYIKGYVPGVRENGGQYTHAAIWAAMAFSK